MVEKQFMEGLQVKINDNKLTIGKYQVPINGDIKAIDKKGKVVVKGKVKLTVYEDGEGYVDYYHCGFMVEIESTSIYNTCFGRRIRITLADLILDAYNENWKIKEV